MNLDTVQRYGEHIVRLIVSFIHSQKLEQCLIDKAKGNSGNSINNGNNGSNGGLQGPPSAGGGMVLPKVYTDALQKKLFTFLLTASKVMSQNPSCRMGPNSTFPPTHPFFHPHLRIRMVETFVSSPLLDT